MRATLPPPSTAPLPDIDGDRDATAFFQRLMRGPLRPRTAEAAAMPLGVGPWTLLGRLGRGGVSTVYEAIRDTPEAPQRAALKLARHATPQARALFRHEARLLGRFDTHHVVRALDVGVHTDGRPYLAMERVAGETITAAATHRSAVERVRLVRRACEAVAVLHAADVVHGDLKPEHLLVRTLDAGAPESIVILDLGIAVDLATPDPSALALKQSLTPEFAAPEQILGEFVRRASDVYALGLVLHEALYGRSHRTPWGLGGDPSAVPQRRRRGGAADDPAEALDCEIEPILCTALQPDPQQRHASAGELATALGDALDAVSGATASA